MKTCLVLLTKTYPFDKGEEFIEDEVPVLAKAFDRLFIVATSTSDTPEQTRSVPANARGFHIPASNVKRALLRTAFSYLPFTQCNGYAGPEERAAVRGSLKRRGFLTYFLAKADAVYRAVSKKLEGCDLEHWDGVTFYSYWFYDTALVAVRLRDCCKAKATRAVSRAHRYDLYADRNATGYLPLRPYLLKHIDRVYPCSANGSQLLQKSYPAYRDKVETAYLGTRDFGLSPKPQENQLQIVSCCHISPVKRVELLAQALSLLEKSGLKLRWTHFGGGDGLEALQAYAKEHLSFMDCQLAGPIRNEDLMAYYRQHPVDIFINTSSSEGLPVSIMEACSFGIPAIATDVGGTSEIVCEGKTGYLLPMEFEPSVLAHHITAFAQLSPAERQALRANCRRIWEEHFFGEHNFTRFAAAIQP